MTSSLSFHTRPIFHLYFAGEALSKFSPLSEDQTAKIISRCKPTSSSMDSIPTKVVLDCLDVLLPVFVNIVNSSLHLDIVPKLLKLLRNNGLNPVANFPCISKHLGRAVTEQ